jgi:O-antigen/teichoic acid export membrane protein
MPSIRAAVVFSSMTKFSVMLIGLASTMVVARLLTPEELGTYAVASAVIMLISEFRILGAAAYLIRESELTEQKVRSALGLTIVISWGLGVLVCIFASSVAVFYELPPIKPIFWILSISFFIAPFLSIADALLARTLSFNLLFRMQIIGSVVAFIVVITLISNGASYYSLAWGQTSATIVQFLFVVFLLRPTKMRYKPLFSGLKPVFSVGIYSSIANILRRFTVVAPDLVIGKAGTTREVSTFSRGLGFIQFVADTLMAGVTPVVLPHLSNTRREGGNVCAAYQHASVLLGGILWPVLIVASLCSLPAIRLFFGDQWDSAAPLAAWLAIWAALRSIHWFSNDMLLALKKEKVMVGKELVVFTLLLSGIIVAYPQGLERIAQVFVMVGLFEFLLITFLLRLCIGLEIIAFIKAFFSNLLIAGICALVVLMIRRWIDFDSAPAWVPILALALVMPPVWFGALWVFRHPLFNEIIGLFTQVKNGDK